MVDNNVELIRRLKAATNYKPRDENPVISSADIVEAEALLGFSLPPLLKSIYLDVRDGGFGPWYHIFHLNKGFHSVVPFYLHLKASKREDTVMYTEGEKDISYWEGEVPKLWPDKVLPICSHGCGRISCVDCSKPELPILVQDDGNSLSQFALERISLSLWLEDWLNCKVTNFHWDTAIKIPFDAFH